MKKILGLDIGTNSIGWALIEQDIEAKAGSIIDAGCRIIPMSQDILGKFDSGVSISQTAERTGFRSVRRLRERHLLRRERLHRVLNILSFLPPHYAANIDFEKHFGQFLPGSEPKLSYMPLENTRRSDFIFKSSFEEMLKDFAKYQPQLLEDGKKVPYDWTIYYLRKKALTQKITKEELAWLLLHFNQKRGYYQLRGEEEEENQNKVVKFYSLRVTDLISDNEVRGETWYSIHLENGWIYRRSSKIPLDWKGKIKDFIVTTELNSDGSIKTDKEGKEKRSFRAPDENDWMLVKKKTEYDLEKSHKTVGAYIYDTLLQNPQQKIKGKLVRVIERKFYHAELEAILDKQVEYHQELSNTSLYKACLKELYPHNEAHKNSIAEKGFVHLFLNDIIFYQRPLKSKKNLISSCKFEYRKFKKDGLLQTEPLKCIAASHPLYQEFRLWQFISNLRIYQKERKINGKLKTDVDVTSELLPDRESRAALFKWMSDRKDIDQDAFLRYPALNLKKNRNNYRWNYVQDKKYPCNETRAQLLTRLMKVKGVQDDFLTKEKEEALWHILYSVEDNIDVKKALKTFAEKNKLSEEFIEHFSKFPSFKKDYGSYSAKAIKKLLPLMRIGSYWNEVDIDPVIINRIENIMYGVVDDSIRERIRDKCISLNSISDFQGLPQWLASYIVYDRHSEDGSIKKWRTADEIELLPQHSLRNPIVEQVINETLQVVRDIWKSHGNGKEDFFNEIHIELGREMKNTMEARKRMSNQQVERENTNQRIRALLAEFLNDGQFEEVRPHSPTQLERLKIYEEGVLNAERDIPDDILKISRQAQPTIEELVKYKLWLQQKYRSPYTGEIIPLNRLFTRAYDIEHIIPQSRYYDDSLSNKVICETVVNGDQYKGNRTAYEFIKEFRGQVVPELSTSDKQITILTEEAYEELVKSNFEKDKIKLKKLLMDDIPDEFIQRQLNDTRYISKVIKNLLSNIVREKNEAEVTSKNIIATNGTITTVLKQDWGFNDIWNELITPRFERLNALTQSNNFGIWTSKEGKEVFQTQVPLILQKGFSKKRIDHRHHLLDAIVIACTARSHVNLLNNESALGKGRSKEEKLARRYDLRRLLCEKKFNDGSGPHYQWVFNKPWDTITQDSKNFLYSCIPSFKQNLRLITKTKNYYSAWKEDGNGKMVKEKVLQEKGQHWAIRKPLHKDTVAGLVSLLQKKTVSLASALDDPAKIVDKPFRKAVQKFLEEGYDKKKIMAHFKETGKTWNGRDFSKVEVYFLNHDNVATRNKVDESFRSSVIEQITDSGIQKILLRHLSQYNEEKNGKIIEHPELAFSPDGIDALNKNLVELNKGRFHYPIYKVRTFEPRGNKFSVGQSGNKKAKFVVAAKGTNLYFGIYKDNEGSRYFETVPLNVAIEREKQGLKPVPEVNEAGHCLIFFLSPNDLVYIPTAEEQANETLPDFGKLKREQLGRIYKIVSFTEGRLYGIPCCVAISIINEVEFGKKNKVEISLDNFSIKNVCVKLRIDRLGKIIQTYK